MCLHRLKWEMEVCRREARESERADFIKDGVRYVATDIMRCTRCGERGVDGYVPPEYKAKVDYLLNSAPAQKGGDDNG